RAEIEWTVSGHAGGAHFAPRRPQRRGNGMRYTRWLQQYAPVVLLVFVLLGGWYAVVKTFQIPEYILPSPTAVAAATVAGDIRWWRHFEVTAAEIALGFVLSGVVGVLLGVMIAWTKVIERTLVPFL